MTPSNAFEYFLEYQNKQAEVLYHVEQRGIYVHKPTLEDIQEELGGLTDELLEGMPAINWNSPKQISEYLYDFLGMPIPPYKGTDKAVTRVKPGERPTSAVSLRYLADWTNDTQVKQTLRRALDYKELIKSKQFAVGLLKAAREDTSRIHCQLAASTETGRLACRNPNLQNIPPIVREVFRAEPGKRLIVFDYSGLEWRILAHAVAKMGDRSLVKDIEAGIDPHGAAAVRMFGLDCDPNECKEKYPELRNAAKTINYGVNYGMSANRLGIQLRDKDGEPIGKEKAQEYLDLWGKANPGVIAFQKRVVAMAKKNGYVRSLLGRYRYLPEINSPDRRTSSGAERQALNSIQNAAADIVSLAMLKTDQFGLVLQVHDELIFEVDEDIADKYAAEIRNRMVHAMDGTHKSLLCPLEVSGGVVRHWGEGH